MIKDHHISSRWYKMRQGFVWEHHTLEDTQYRTRSLIRRAIVSLSCWGELILSTTAEKKWWLKGEGWVVYRRKWVGSRDNARRVSSRDPLIGNGVQCWPLSQRGIVTGDWTAPSAVLASQPTHFTSRPEPDLNQYFIIWGKKPHTHTRQ